MNIEKVVLNEVYYLKFKLPDYVFNAIKAETYDLMSRNFVGAQEYNYSLAGSIEHEYALFNCAEVIDDFFSHQRFAMGDKVLKLVRAKSRKNPNIIIPSLWANFQKKYEYNPLHNHDGDVSFVVWVKVPYELEKERKQPHAQSGTAPSAPAFSFVYSPVFARSNYHVETHRIEVDSSYEGMCILFHSGLQHMVSPFYTTDDYRISVSGNFNLVNQ